MSEEELKNDKEVDLEVKIMVFHIVFAFMLSFVCQDPFPFVFVSFIIFNFLHLFYSVK